MSWYLDLTLSCYDFYVESHVSNLVKVQNLYFFELCTYVHVFCFCSPFFPLCCGFCPKKCFVKEFMHFFLFGIDLSLVNEFTSTFMLCTC